MFSLACFSEDLSFWIVCLSWLFYLAKDLVSTLIKCVRYCSSCSFLTYRTNTFIETQRTPARLWTLLVGLYAWTGFCASY
jgi:maltodextrin utilization protein YvdJ